MLVVGGGPAGASTACHLVRQGIRVTILDRARFPRDKPCAEYLSPQASRILAAMGALRIIEERGPAHLGGMLVRAPNGEHIRGDFAANHGFRGFRDRGLAIRRHVLDEIPLSQARDAGAEVLEQVRVTNLMHDARGRVTGVETLDADGRAGVRHAGIVIGADGLRSIVARRLGLARRLPWPRRIAFVTHYRGVRGVGERGEMHVERGGYLGIADVGGGLTNVALVVPMASVHGIDLDPAGYLDRWLDSHAQLAGRFAGAERVSKVSATGPFASAVRRAWASGAALVGDAADFFDPFTGEGICSALAGGELAAMTIHDALSRPGAIDASRLARYRTLRRRAFLGKWVIERMIGYAMLAPALFDRAVERLDRRGMADTLIGVTGQFVSPWRILNPVALAKMLV